jgi:ABC-type lipoprotein release transport system permease subunit
VSVGRLVPLRYPLRSLVVRWYPTLFSALGIALTVAVFGAVLALREGFRTVVADTGRDDVWIYLRPGAQSESESVLRHPSDTSLLKARPEVARAEDGSPIAAAESVTGVKLRRADGAGIVLVTVRGVEEASFAVHEGRFRLVEGRLPRFGLDEVVVGAPLAGRVEGCRVGETIRVNVTPFLVVGLFQHDGAYASEVWGDAQRLGEAMQKPTRQRLVARAREGADLAAAARELESDRRTPIVLRSEREYYRSQTSRLGGTLLFLAVLTTSFMGAAAALGAVNTMLASVGSRTREVGVLVSLGYRARAVFLSFLVEAGVVGVLGGLLGSAIVLPLHGLRTDVVNWNTFTQVAFAFRVTPALLLRAGLLAVGLGVLGGAVPAWRASRLAPTAALRGR